MPDTPTSTVTSRRDDHGWRIRAARADDLDAIVQLAVDHAHADLPHDWRINPRWPRTDREWFLDRIQDENWLVLAAESTEPPQFGVVAHLIAEAGGGNRVTVDSATIDLLWVEEEWRRRGIGRALVDGFTAWARARGCRKRMVGVYATNLEALAFYRAIGYADFSIFLAADLTTDPA